MNIETDVELPEFEIAKLRSERVRTLCMACVFAAFVMLGVFRIVMPYEGRRSLGVFVFAMSLGYLILELWMFSVVGVKVERRRALDRRLAVMHGIVECLYPIAGIFLLTLLYPPARYTYLVSPGYAFLFVLIAASVLRVEASATAWTGAIAALGYGGVVVWALAGADSSVASPHPPLMYATLTAMLGVATAVAVFVSRQVHGYVLAAVREMEIRQQRDRLKHDLEIARQIQQRLLPRSLPDYAGYEFAAVSRPADQTGGDYYDWQEFSPRRAVFSLGDVSGHGIGPALVTAACRAYVRAILGNGPAPAAVLQRVNRLLHSDLTESRFVTLALLDLNADTNEVHLLSAGHGPTLHVRGIDGEIRQIDAQGLPLGLYDDGMLEEAVQFPLSPGDLIVLCSDGFFEPANPAGEEFGLDRLCDLIRKHRQEPADRIVSVMEQTVREFLGAAPQPDDMTALVIKRIP